MTREEAIRIFRKEIECLSHAKCEDCILEKVCDPAKTTPLDSEYIEAYGMAIQALSQEPCDECKYKTFTELYFHTDPEMVEQEPMRDFTEEEAEAYSKTLDRMYKPTGLNVFNEPCTDAVSREAVLKLKHHKPEYGDMIYAFDIEQLPSVNPQPCDDAISREAVINIVKLRWDYYKNCIEAIEKLPSVTQKSGEWILLDECANSGYYCSNCQKKLVKEGWSPTVKKIKYCPNCGAKMVESQESEEEQCGK